MYIYIAKLSCEQCMFPCENWTSFVDEKIVAITRRFMHECITQNLYAHHAHCSSSHPGHVKAQVCSKFFIHVNIFFLEKKFYQDQHTIYIYQKWN